MRVHFTFLAFWNCVRTVATFDLRAAEGVRGGTQIIRTPPCPSTDTCYRRANHKHLKSFKSIKSFSNRNIKIAISKLRNQLSLLLISLILWYYIMISNTFLFNTDRYLAA